MILGFVKPFESPEKNISEYINELVILGVLYCMMLFTDMLPNL